MSRITHIQHQPKSVYYWDYYILCRLNVAAAIALQRMEYWDGTKEAIIPQAEALNEALVANNKPATQDTSHWIYKTQDELQWELMGITGEKGVAALTKFLEEEVQYLVSRHNLYLAFDRKKQYEFQAEKVQMHSSYLGYLIHFFEEMNVRLTPVYYAIELLTREGVFIEELSVQKIVDRMVTMRTEKKLPTFVKNGLTTTPLSTTPCRVFAEWAEWKKARAGVSIPQKSGMQATRIEESIPQKSGNNSSNYYQLLPSITTTEEVALSNSSSSQSEHVSAAAIEFSVESVTEEEKALILAYRTLKASPKPSENRERTADESKQTAILALKSSEEALKPLGSGAPEREPTRPREATTAEEVVRTWEQVRGVRYEKQERAAQMRAATTLLGIELANPLTPQLLETLYTTYFDNFWKRTYGELHLTHLVDVEKSSGQVRVVRWVKRLRFQSLPARSTREPERGREEPVLPYPPPDFNNYLQEEEGDLIQDYLDGKLTKQFLTPELVAFYESQIAERKALAAGGGR